MMLATTVCCLSVLMDGHTLDHRSKASPLDAIRRFLHAVDRQDYQGMAKEVQNGNISFAYNKLIGDSHVFDHLPLGCSLRVLGFQQQGPVARVSCIVHCKRLRNETTSGPWDWSEDLRLVHESNAWKIVPSHVPEWVSQFSISGFSERYLIKPQTLLDNRKSEDAKLSDAAIKLGKRRAQIFRTIRAMPREEAGSRKFCGYAEEILGIETSVIFPSGDDKTVFFLCEAAKHDFAWLTQWSVVNGNLRKIFQRKLAGGRLESEKSSSTLSRWIEQKGYSVGRFQHIHLDRFSTYRIEVVNECIFYEYVDALKTYQSESPAPLYRSLHRRMPIPDQEAVLGKAGSVSREAKP